MTWAWTLLAVAVAGQLALLFAARRQSRGGHGVSRSLRWAWLGFGGMGIAAAAALSHALLVLAQAAVCIALWRSGASRA
jgi:hypothetical protein